MKKKFIKQAKLPRGAYTKDLKEVLGPLAKRSEEQQKYDRRKDKK